MSSVKDAMSATPGAPRSNPRLQLDGWTPLEDPATRYLAAACLRHGQPVVEVAEVLGMCAEECAALLGVEADA